MDITDSFSLLSKILGTGELHSKDSVCDPCCGSGKMLLSATKQFVEQEGESNDLNVMEQT